MSDLHRPAKEAHRKTYSVRRAAELERVKVVLHVGRVDARFPDALLEQLRVVHSLGTRKNLLAAHEKVVRVGQFLRSAHGSQRDRPGGRLGRGLTGSDGSGMV